MENTKKAVPFKAIYSDDFTDKLLVEQIISDWQNGAKTFTISTSGSTGKPKVIKLARQILIWSAEATKSSLGLGEECIFCCLPITKTGGFMQVIRALHFNWEIYLKNPTSNPMNDEDLSIFTLTSLTPTQLLFVLRDNADKLKSFSNVLIGGAPVSKNTLEKLSDWNKKNTFTTFWETYGMTETASHIALKNITIGDNYFKPQLGVEISENQHRLTISIAQLALDLETNDLVKISNQGFELIGRADNVINTGGVKVHPEVIEPLISDILHSLQIFRKFYLISKPDEKLGEQVVLVLEGVPIKNTRFILELLKRELPTYMHPKEIVFTPKIEFTDTGKLIRKSI